MRDEVTLHQGWATSLEGEMTRTQKLSIEMEGQLVKALVGKQQDVNELKKIKEDRDTAIGKLER